MGHTQTMLTSNGGEGYPTQMLTVNVMINVLIIGQPPVSAIIRWRARLAYESTVTVMDPISGTTLLTLLQSNP